MQEIHTIESGEWQSHPHLEDYRAEWPADMLVERATWGADAPTQEITAQSNTAVTIAGPGYIWFRFWLPDHDQVVERYFDDAGEEIGTYIPVCAPLERTGKVYRARHLLLSLWLEADARITALHEEDFDAAVEAEQVTPVEAERAESQFRTLTMAVGQKSFPPALVRNLTIRMEDAQDDETAAQSQRANNPFSSNLGEY